MTDRELLEQAAKAAFDGFRWNDGYELLEVWNNGDKTMTFWNPLVDDGAALRLAARLNITVGPVHTAHGMYIGSHAWPYGRGDCNSQEESDDRYKNYRQAIVCAAAALSKEKGNG